MPRYRRTAILGLLTGAIAVAIFFSRLGRACEDEALSWLFVLRGPIDPPAEVVVVDTQTTSPRALAQRAGRRGFPARPSQA